MRHKVRLITQTDISVLYSLTDNQLIKFTEATNGTMMIAYNVLREPFMAQRSDLHNNLTILHGTWTTVLTKDRSSSTDTYTKKTHQITFDTEKGSMVSSVPGLASTSPFTFHHEKEKNLFFGTKGHITTITILSSTEVSVITQDNNKLFMAKKPKTK